MLCLSLLIIAVTNLWQLMCYSENFKQTVLAYFGQYHQVFGAKYDISIKLVYEIEKKLRMMSVLKLTLNNQQFTLKQF